jgi:hypothetical protein
MKLTKKEMAFVSGIQSLFELKFGTRRILNIDVEEKESGCGFRGSVQVSFGPTHHLTFQFDGDVDEKEMALGAKWEMSYQDDNEITAVATSAEWYDQPTWDKFKETLGLP